MPSSPARSAPSRPCRRARAPPLPFLEGAPGFFSLFRPPAGGVGARRRASDRTSRRCSRRRPTNRRPKAPGSALITVALTPRLEAAPAQPLEPLPDLELEPLLRWLVEDATDERVGQV